MLHSICFKENTLAGKCALKIMLNNIRGQVILILLLKTNIIVKQRWRKIILFTIAFLICLTIYTLKSPSVSLSIMFHFVLSWYTLRLHFLVISVSAFQMETMFGLETALHSITVTHCHFFQPVSAYAETCSCLLFFNVK